MNVDATGSRKAQVQAWLRDIQNNRRVYGDNIRMAVNRSQLVFPSSLVLRVGLLLAKAWAKTYVRSMIEEGASSLNLTLDSGEIELLTDLALDAVGG